MNGLLPLPWLLPLTAAALSIAAFGMRRWNVAHEFRTGGLSCLIGTILIGIAFALWAATVPGAITPGEAVLALVALDAAAGIGAVATWIFMDWQERDELDGADRAEQPHA